MQRKSSKIISNYNIIIFFGGNMGNLCSEENRVHSTLLVPFSYYKCLIPDYFAAVPFHWHSEFEINHIISGCAEFICGDDKFVSAEGDIIIIPPNMFHAIYPHDNSKQIYDTIVFSPEMLGASENDRSAVSCVRPIINGEFVVNSRITKEHIYYDEIKISVDNIFSCAKGNTPQLDMLMKSELLRLFWLLEISGDIYCASENAVSTGGIIRPAIEYMNENIGEDITIELLADTVHLSKSYFMRCFKKTVGIGAIEYLAQLRVKKVCALLCETDMTASEAAFGCGFRNLSNFNRRFKEIMGCTPREYRKAARKKG